MIDDLLGHPCERSEGDDADAALARLWAAVVAPARRTAHRHA
ncbi:hypothetical protein [Streptomyces sp. NPDC101166]